MRLSFWGPEVVGGGLDGEPLFGWEVKLEEVIELDLSLERITSEEVGEVGTNWNHAMRVTRTRLLFFVVDGFVPIVGVAIEDINVSHLSWLVVDHLSSEDEQSIVVNKTLMAPSLDWLMTLLLLRRPSWQQSA